MDVYSAEHLKVESTTFSDQLNVECQGQGKESLSFSHKHLNKRYQLLTVGGLKEEQISWAKAERRRVRPRIKSDAGQV